MYISPKIELTMNGYKKEKFFCDICNYCLITGEDHDLHSEYGACEECFKTFIEGRKATWDKSQKHKLIDKNKLKEYLYLRKNISDRKISFNEE